jgi:hypothetical protein
MLRSLENPAAQACRKRAEKLLALANKICTSAVRIKILMLAEYWHRMALAAEGAAPPGEMGRASRKI